MRACVRVFVCTSVHVCLCVCLSVACILFSKSTLAHTWTCGMQWSRPTTTLLATSSHAQESPLPLPLFPRLGHSSTKLQNIIMCFHSCLSSLRSTLCLFFSLWNNNNSNCYSCCCNNNNNINSQAVLIFFDWTQLFLRLFFAGRLTKNFEYFCEKNVLKKVNEKVQVWLS